MSVPNSIRYGAGSSAGSGLPAPADKGQTKSYMQNAQNVGTVQTEKSEHVVVRDYVYSTLWKNVKFITSETELDFEGLVNAGSKRGRQRFNLKRLLGQKSL
jgi:hypothetical protein